MKNIIYALAATVFTITTLHTGAQQVNDELKVSKTYNFVPGFNQQTSVSHRNLYQINFKAVRDFVKTYPEISNEKWEILKDGYVVSFVLNTVWKKNFYDEKGRWLQSIDQYGEINLPENVRASVKRIYYDYAITIIQEVNEKRTGLDPTYYVHIKYAATFKIIKVYNGEVEELKPDEY